MLGAVAGGAAMAEDDGGGLRGRPGVRMGGRGDHEQRHREQREQGAGEGNAGATGRSMHSEECTTRSASRG